MNNLLVDKNYCMSSFLTFRFIFDKTKIFKEGIERANYPLPEIKYMIHSSDDINMAIQDVLLPVIDDKTGIMLSGGMDSAILASYLPAGTKAYTLESQAEVAKKETKEAQSFAEICNLEHHVIEITWEDYEKYAPLCMKQKGTPIHSIEPMIYKAAMQAKTDGCTKLIFGENADIKFGGMDGLLAKEWKKAEFKKRYTYVEPSKVLKNPVDISQPFDSYEKENYYDSNGFINEYFLFEAHNTYSNACKTAEIEYITPFVYMQMGITLDLQRVRNGDSKYLIRELFLKRYPNSIPAVKLPMPRGVGIWLKDWKGPVRDEFLPDCVNDLTGDQKWYVYVLEWFLNLIDSK
jgi:asparagine synthetase B (glutamine-hydrolysing)